MLSSRGSSQPRNWTQVSRFVGRFFCLSHQGSSLSYLPNPTDCHSQFYTREIYLLDEPLQGQTSDGIKRCGKRNSLIFHSLFGTTCYVSWDSLMECYTVFKNMFFSFLHFSTFNFEITFDLQKKMRKMTSRISEYPSPSLPKYCHFFFFLLRRRDKNQKVNISKILIHSP